MVRIGLYRWSSMRSGWGRLLIGLLIGFAVLGLAVIASIGPWPVLSATQEEQQSVIASKLSAKGGVIICRGGYPFDLSFFDADGRIADVSDADAEMIGQLRYLSGLTLSTGPPGFHNPRVTDATLEKIRGLDRLRSLLLINTGITDRGLLFVAKMEALEHLDLSGTAITDKGLSKLSSLKRLRRVYLKNTRVTPEGVRRLSVTLPKCSILLNGVEENPESSRAIAK